MNADFSVTALSSLFAKISGVFSSSTSSEALERRAGDKAESGASSVSRGKEPECVAIKSEALLIESLSGSSF